MVSSNPAPAALGARGPAAMLQAREGVHSMTGFAGALLPAAVVVLLQPLAGSTGLAARVKGARRHDHGCSSIVIAGRAARIRYDE